MRFLSWGIVAACGFLLAGPAAKATDLRIPDPPSPHYNWTGFYAGVYGGGAYAAWAADYCRNGACRHAEGQAGGFAVGVYGGYNYQFANRFVIGGELDWGISLLLRDEHLFGDSALLSVIRAFSALLACAQATRSTACWQSTPGSRCSTPRRPPPTPTSSRRSSRAPTHTTRRRAIRARSPSRRPTTRPCASSSTASRRSSCSSRASGPTSRSSRSSSRSSATTTPRTGRASSTTGRTR